MSFPKPGLGRGLSALIPPSGPSEAVEEVDIDLVIPNPEQPRMRMDAEALETLTQSIREHGVIQPLLVSRSGTHEGTYQLIAGERRLRAARAAGLTKVPVIVKEAAGRALLELALVENIQRADLNPLEEAAAFRRLHDDFGLTQEEIARRVGRSRTAVANTMRLLSLSEEIRLSLARGEITEGHARALLGIEDARARDAAWRRVVDEGLSVRETEALVRGEARRAAAEPAQRAPRAKAPEVAELERRLEAALGTRVTLSPGRRGGRVVIHYYTAEQLDDVVKRLEGAQGRTAPAPEM
ncbi:MAG TPA: ParB/RepB/Spo0J family partition protein [Dehalococcoidia bacterium]|nr:ParB/RepB/Spo0J family partition protein [Dehalococcoidia bacterium]